MINETIKYVGVNDHQIDLFEGQYKVNGMSYNSYVIMDEKIAVMDTVDKSFTHEWLDNIQKVLNGKEPTYLVVSHMEPDHSANIKNFLTTYPKCLVVGNVKTFQMINAFFPGFDIESRKVIVKDMDTLNLGIHTLTFVFAPMVHWPEVMMSYESKTKTLFSADAFGKFGANDIVDDWILEARRYYIGIVGKYGNQVINILKKASTLDIKQICPLHGPVLNNNLSKYISLYETWASYDSEIDGVAIFYTSVYGNTKDAALILKEKLTEANTPNVVIQDLARTDLSSNVALAFAYSKIVLATTTYNAALFPAMDNFLHALKERNFQNKKIAIIENGSWAPMVIKLIKESLGNQKNLIYTENLVHIKSALNKDSSKELENMALELSKEYSKSETAKNDMTALFKVGYGLYVVTSNDGNRDNGLIVNTVTQVTNTPNRIAVTINKENYSYHVISQTKKMNVNVLSIDAPFKVFETFGFQSGRNADKFKDISKLKSENNLAYLPKYINALISLEVTDIVDLKTHAMFICEVTEARVLSDRPTMSYTYYQENVKPKPNTEKKGFVCKVCGYVYEGDVLPDDYICPLCKHGASDFEKIE